MNNLQATGIIVHSVMHYKEIDYKLQSICPHKVLLNASPASEELLWGLCRRITAAWLQLNSFEYITLSQRHCLGINQCISDLFFSGFINNSLALPFHTHSLTNMPCVHLSISADGAAAVSTGVGAKLIKAFGAHVLVILLDVLLPVQLVTAIVAVEALGHG